MKTFIFNGKTLDTQKMVEITTLFIEPIGPRIDMILNGKFSMKVSKPMQFLIKMLLVNPH
jgi:hypothetical protein